MTKKTTKETKLTNKEIEILILLYRFRYLNRVQIQRMLSHKSRTLVVAWLKKLSEMKLVNYEFDKKFACNPAVYSLNLLSRKYLKNHPQVQSNLLNRVWREKNYTEGFKEHCLFLADINLSLLDLVSQTKGVLHFSTKTDLYGKKYIIQPKPDCFFEIEEENEDTNQYFLDSLNDLPPRILRMRARRYFEYYDSDIWFEKYPDKLFPEIIFVCPNTRTKGHLYFYIRSQLDEYPELNFYLTTKELVQKNGLTSKTLEKVTPRD